VVVVAVEAADVAVAVSRAVEATTTRRVAEEEEEATVEEVTTVR
jgi:hypothetical protein